MTNIRFAIKKARQAIASRTTSTLPGMFLDRHRFKTIIYEEAERLNMESATKSYV